MKILERAFYLVIAILIAVLIKMNMNLRAESKVLKSNLDKSDNRFMNQSVVCNTHYTAVLNAQYKLRKLRRRVALHENKQLRKSFHQFNRAMRSRMMTVTNATKRE